MKSVLMRINGLKFYIPFLNIPFVVTGQAYQNCCELQLSKVPACLGETITLMGCINEGPLTPKGRGSRKYSNHQKEEVYHDRGIGR